MLAITSLVCTQVREVLVDAARERLSPMRSVAEWKWCHQKPIEDLVRENQILGGLDNDEERIFLRRQMNIAKDIQRQAFSEFSHHAPNCSIQTPEALSQIRSQLDQSTQKVLKALRDLKTQACPNEVIFVQAGIGSFNHQAVLELLAKNPEPVDLYFAGTPKETMRLADQLGGDAFVAIRNDLVGPIPATEEAFLEFEIVEKKGEIRLPINMCLMRYKAAEEPLTAISSHPAALEQIKLWKMGRNLTEIPEEKGTSEAARRLAVGELGTDTGVIGPRLLADIYPNLQVVACDLQDTHDVHTTFLRFKPEKRPGW